MPAFSVAQATQRFIEFLIGELFKFAFYERRYVYPEGTLICT